MKNYIYRIMVGIRDNVYYILGILYCKMNRINIKVMSIEDTIEAAKTNSIIRFGDGEIALMNGKSIVYQSYNKGLQDQLKGILDSNNEGLLICLPDIFDGVEHLNNKDRFFHLKFIFYYRNFFMKKVVKSKVYGNTFVSRPYMILKNKTNSKKYFESLQTLWEGKEVIIVEGEFSKSGVGNDLFSKCKSIERVVCPSQDSYSAVNQIVEELLTIDKNKLLLFALGPTAKIIISKIHPFGYHCIDIGHLDSEYEWFKINSTKKVRINGKHTAEFSDDVSNVGINDINYAAQILKKIV